MPSKTVTVGSAVGLHARPAAVISEAVVNAGVPVTLALDEGQYELVFRSEAGESVRFLFVRAGQTRIVRPER